MRVTVAIILETVAAFRGVSVADLKGERRDQAITIPRFEACYLASELTGLSYPAIGRHIGNRDHTTILAAKRRVEERLTSYPILRREMDDLRLLVRKAMGEAQAIQIMDARKIDAVDVAQRVLDADLPCTVVTSDEVRALAHFVAQAALADPKQTSH